MKVSLSMIEKRLETIERAQKKKMPKVVSDEFQESVKRRVEEYNSPDAETKRSTDYDEIQRIGKLRAEAFSKGEPMDRYPLPWKTEEALEVALIKLEKNKALMQELDPIGWEESYDGQKKHYENELARRRELDDFYLRKELRR